MPVHFETRAPVAIVTLDRPEVANAIDRPTAGSWRKRSRLPARSLRGRRPPCAAIGSRRTSSGRSRSRRLLHEYQFGMQALHTGELRSGLERYASGRWRGGDLS